MTEIGTLKPYGKSHVVADGDVWGSGTVIYHIRRGFLSIGFPAGSATISLNGDDMDDLLALLRHYRVRALAEMGESNG